MYSCREIYLAVEFTKLFVTSKLSLSLIVCLEIVGRAFVTWEKGVCSMLAHSTLLYQLVN